MSYDRRDFPNRITVELTNRCNVDCIFCPRQHVSMPLGDMTKSLFIDIVNEASNHLPVSMVLFFRGESLLHEHFLEFIVYAKAKGIYPVQIATNALLLDETRQDALIDAEIDFLSVSLDTNNADKYAKSRKGGNLEVSKKNLISFCEKCKLKRLAGKKTPEIQISTVDIEEYRDEKDVFIDFWRKHADIVRVYTEHSSDGNMGSVNSASINSTLRKPCMKVYTDMVVYWDGTVALCNHDWDNDLNIGNVNSTSIYDVWNGDTYERIRRMHESGNFKNSIVCKNCDHWLSYYTDKGFLGELYKN